MKKIMGMLSTLAVILCPFISHAFADIIELRGDYFCPYNCNPKDVRPGLMVEVAQHVFEKAGHQVNYQLLSYDEAIQGVASNMFQGVVGVEKLEASDFIYPTESFGSFHNVFWQKKEFDWHYTGISSLEPILLLAVRGYRYGEPIDSYIAKHKEDPLKVMFVYGANGVAEGARVLEAVDDVVFLEDVAVMNYYLGNSGKAAGFRQQPSGLAPVPFYIAFSPKNPKSNEYAQILSDGIVELKKNGEWDKLLEFYHIAK